MEEYLHQLVEGLPLYLLIGLIVLMLGVLGKSADWLVAEAVALSERSGVPKMVIGATIVSLGTTTPEAVISVLAAIKGDPSLALGNAVGSIICDTGLVLGPACLIAPLHLPRMIVNRQGWLQLGSGFLLVGACFPFLDAGRVFQTGPEGGGYLSQWQGFVFLALLALYLWLSARWAKQDVAIVPLDDLEVDVNKPLPWIVVKLVLAITLVVVASYVLIPAVQETAERIGIPSAVIAASLVAFGTSLPELVTAVTAARRGHGDLAVGNIIGADILNVLFVTGAAAGVTPRGLHATPYFFLVLFPAMLFALIVFRVGIIFSKESMRRPFGFVLLAVYVIAMLASYVFRGTSG